MKDLKSIFNLLVLLLVIAFSSCNKAEKTAVVKANSAPNCLTDSLQKMIAIENVTQEHVLKEINLNGKLTVNENTQASIYPKVTGIVNEVKVELGDVVKKGDLLAVLESADITELNTNLNAAVANLTVAHKNLETSKELFESKLGSERDYIFAQQELAKAKSEVAKAKDILHLFGAQGISGQEIRAPRGGYIIQRNISTGSDVRVNDGTPLFVIADLDEIWVKANVYESDIEQVKIGLTSNIKVLSYPDLSFSGTIDKLYEVLDPVNRSMQVRIKLANPNHLLKPEMFANVTLLSKQNFTLPAINADAIIFDNNRYYVIVYRDKCDYEARLVQVESISSGKAYIKSGLKAGERVITKEQLLAFETITNE